MDLAIGNVSHALPAEQAVCTATGAQNLLALNDTTQSNSHRRERGCSGSPAGEIAFWELPPHSVTSLVKET